MVSASTSFDLAELQTYFPAALLIILPLLILYICDARVFDKNGKRIQGPYSHLFGPSFFGIMRRGRNEKCPSRTILNELLNKLGDGKIVGCNVFGKIFLITCDPDYVKVVLNGKPSLFPKHERYSRMKFALGEGLFTSSGDSWKAHRTMLNPSFHAEALKCMVDGFNIKSKSLVEIIMNVARGKTTQPFITRVGGDDANTDANMNKKSEVILSLNQYIPALSLSTFLLTAFSYNFNIEQFTTSTFVQDINNILNEISARISDNFDSSHKWFPEREARVNASLNNVNKLINTIIADRKQSRAAAATAAESQGDKTAKDLLDIILNASETDLSPQYLRDEIITFMGAGHETTSTTTMWTLYELCRHPSILVKLQQEIDGILGNPTSTDRIEVIIYENLNKFEYLTAVIKETLRLHPPVSMIGRKNLEDYQLGEFMIRKNSLIGINMLALHTNPVYWKDPWEYKPDRWLDGTKIHPFQYIPFSAGGRNCLGQRFANMELIVMLGHLLSNFDVRMTADQLSSMREEETVVTQPTNLDMIFTPRC